MAGPEAPALVIRQAELRVDAPRTAAKREAQERSRAPVPVVRVAAVIRHERVATVRDEMPAIGITIVRAEVPAIGVAIVRAVVPAIGVAIVRAVVRRPVGAVTRPQRPVRVPPRRHGRRVIVRVRVVAIVHWGVHRRLAGILSRRGVDGSRGAVGACQGIGRQGDVRHDRFRPGRRCGGLFGQRGRLRGRGQVALILALGGAIDQSDDRQPLVNDRYRLAVGAPGRRLLPASELAEVPGLWPGRHRKRRRQLVQRQLAVTVVRLDKRDGAVGRRLRARPGGAGQRRGIVKSIRDLLIVSPIIGCGGSGLRRHGRRINGCVCILARLA
jgi:hypothetical protein